MMASLPTCPTQGKLQYPSQTQAIRSALRSSRRRGTPLRTYKCPHCSKYHLTSKPKLDILDRSK